MLKNKKGFSLVECLIALLVISIVTVSGFAVFRLATEYNKSSWDRYSAEIMADNTLACFQSTDNATSFKARLDGFAQHGDAISNTVTQMSAAKYYNKTFVSESAANPQFNTIVASDNNKNVKFLNGTEEKFSITYTDDNYKTNVHDDASTALDKLTSAYTATKTNTITVDAINGISSKFDRYDCYSSIQYVISNDKVNLYYRQYTDGGISNRTHYDISYDTTPLEKYYLNNNMFVYFTQKSFGTSGEIRLVLLQMTNDANGNTTISQVKEGNKYVYVKLTYDNSPSGNWYSDGTGYHITGVYKATSTKAATTTTDATNYTGTNGWKINASFSIPNGSWTQVSDISTGFYWKYVPMMFKNEIALTNYASYFPAYLLNSNVSSSTEYYADPNEYFKIVKTGNEGTTDFPKGGTKLVISTTYKANPEGTTYKIDYALYKKDTEIRLYNDKKVLLYSCTGAKANDVLALLPFADTGVDVDGFDKYAVVSADIKINKVQLNESAKTVSFLNSSGESIITFSYSSLDTLKEDWAKYKTLYKTDYTVNDATDTTTYQIHQIINPVTYQIVMVKDEAHTIIYSANAEAQVITQKPFAEDGKAKSKEIEVPGNSVTYYYSYLPEGASVGVYCRVTFSDVSVSKRDYNNPAQSISYEPKLDVWVLSKANINALLGDIKNRDTILKNQTYITYRKG